MFQYLKNTLSRTKCGRVVRMIFALGKSCPRWGVVPREVHFSPVSLTCVGLVFGDIKFVGKGVYQKRLPSSTVQPAVQTVRTRRSAPLCNGTQKHTARTAAPDRCAMNALIRQSQQRNVHHTHNSSEDRDLHSTCKHRLGEYRQYATVTTGKAAAVALLPKLMMTSVMRTGAPILV